MGKHESLWRCRRVCWCSVIWLSAVRQFLLFSSQLAVRGIPFNLSTQEDIILPVTGTPSYFVGVDFSAADDSIFFSDTVKDIIYKQKVDGTGKSHPPPPHSLKTPPSNVSKWYRVECFYCWIPLRTWSIIVVRSLHVCAVWCPWPLGQIQCETDTPFISPPQRLLCANNTFHFMRSLLSAAFKGQTHEIMCSVVSEYLQTTSLTQNTINSVQNPEPYVLWL